jgi:predicted phage tail protein
MASLTLLLTYLGGRYKKPIVAIIFGFVLMYITDFTFSFVISNGSYFNGHFVDFLFATVMAILSLGVIQLAPPTAHKKEETTAAASAHHGVDNSSLFKASAPTDSGSSGASPSEV